MAQAMGEDEVARLLNENLEQEKAALTKVQTIGEAPRRRRRQGNGLISSRGAETTRLGAPRSENGAAVSEASGASLPHRHEPTRDLLE